MPLLPADSEFLCRLVRDRSGIVLGEDNARLLESRLLPLAQVTGFESIEELAARLRFEPTGPLAQQVVEVMIANEAGFFRGVSAFECLRRVVFPTMVAQRATECRLDAWCANAANGYEPYSLAIALREYAPQMANWQIRMVATDISPDALNRAREARYSQLEVERGLPAPLLATWCTKEDIDWRVNDDIRRIIQFRELNLLDSAWPLTGSFDIIFLRYALTYVDIDAKRYILGKCRRLLRPDGFLFLGANETTVNIDDGFMRVDPSGCHRLKPTT
ncbi:MAG: protein-glutamate O-methyltransferase CheR [Planctomycetota bacterium]